MKTWHHNREKVYAFTPLGLVYEWYTRTPRYVRWQLFDTQYHDGETPLESFLHHCTFQERTRDAFQCRLIKEHHYRYWYFHYRFKTVMKPSLTMRIPIRVRWPLYKHTKIGVTVISGFDLFSVVSVSNHSVTRSIDQWNYMFIIHPLSLKQSGLIPPWIDNFIYHKMWD